MGQVSLCFVADEQTQQTCCNDSSHIFVSFHSKCISTNATVVISLHLGPEQFNGVEIAMIW